MNTTLLFAVVVPLLIANIIHQAWIVPHNTFPRLKIPMDMGAKIQGIRILGNHKTWRGFIVIIVLSLMLAMLAGIIANDIATYTLSAFVASVGYMLGELPNSFAKRQCKIVEGQNGSGWLGKFFLFANHSDSILGAAVALALVGYPYPLLLWASALGITTHILVDGTLRYLHLK